MPDSRGLRRRRYHQAEEPIPAPVRAAVEEAIAAVGPIRPDQALPLLQQVQARLGSLSPVAIQYASRMSRIPMAHLNALVQFYDLLHAEPQGEVVIHVCDDLVCRHAAEAPALKERLKAEGKTVRLAPCLGQCDRAPATLQVASGPTGSAGPAGPAGPGPTGPATQGRETPAHKGCPDGFAPRLLARCGRYDPTSQSSYAATGGLTALALARKTPPADLVGLVKASKLVGRGGAAFPTGIKWEAVLGAPTPLGPGPDGARKYVVVNADESEPGTFTNRLLMEEDPCGVVEAALIAAHAVQAEQVYIYIRGEYPLAIERITTAIATLQPPIPVAVRAGGGAYVCGEETALFASIEGERGEPRVKPPFPTTNGLFGRPTLINNVETLHNLHALLSEGPEDWNAVQPKLFSISGHIRKPGVYEMPLGTPLADLIALAGGPVGEIQAVLMGGASGMFLAPDQLRTPLDFKAMTAAGATLGSGAVMIFNTETDLWDVARRAARFFAEESCGKCVPCRAGTARQEELVERLAAGETQWVPLLADLSQSMADASICGLGQTATNALRSLLKLKGVLE